MNVEKYFGHKRSKREKITKKKEARTKQNEYGAKTGVTFLYSSP